MNYMRTRVLDDEFYAQLIIDYLREFESAPLREIDAFLRDELPDSFSEEQRDNKVRNMLARLRKDRTIHSVGSTRAARWTLKLSQIKQCHGHLPAGRTDLTRQFVNLRTAKAISNNPKGVGVTHPHPCGRLQPGLGHRLS